MEKLQIVQGAKTPKIDFDTTGYLEISGRSVPENAVEFYAPVFKWLDDINTFPATGIKLLVHLEYFNTSSSKCLLDIFRKLESLHLSGKTIVSIAWLYDEGDDDMLESGEDYQQIVKVPFTFGKAD